MANTVQARKRVRQNTRRRAVNASRTNRIRSFVRQVEAAIAAGNKKEAEAAFKQAKPEIARGVSNGVFHKRTAARKLSRLERRINSLLS